MRYVIVGAGAVGATIGGRLAESGRDVVLVARGEHGRVLREKGLRLVRPDGEVVLRCPTATVEDLSLQAEDVLVLAVKSQDSEAVLAQLAAKVLGRHSAGDELPLLCAQNGVSNEDAALRFFERVHGISVNLPATHLEPGVVHAEGAPLSGVLQIGRYPGRIDDLDREVSADLNDSWFSCTPREDVMAWKRAKLLGNLGNALEVLCRERVDHRAVRDCADPIAQLLDRAKHEALACFAAARLTTVSEATYHAHPADLSRPAPIQGQPRGGGSTWQSVQRGSHSVETDFLNGEVVRLGRLFGVSTPVNVDIQARMRTFSGPVSAWDLLADLAAQSV